MDTSDRALLHRFKGPGAVVSDLTGIKNALVKCLFVFELELNSLDVLNVVIDKKYKGLRSGERGGCTSKLVCVFLFPRFAVGTNS
jgi:hypothetical protein